MTTKDPKDPNISKLAITPKIGQLHLRAMVWIMAELKHRLYLDQGFLLPLILIRWRLAPGRGPRETRQRISVGCPQAAKKGHKRRKGESTQQLGVELGRRLLGAPVTSTSHPHEPLDPRGCTPGSCPIWGSLFGKRQLYCLNRKIMPKLAYQDHPFWVSVLASRSCF